MTTQSDLPVLREPEEPSKKSSVKLIVILSLLFVILLSVIFFTSTLSKITEIQISGSQFITNNEIIAGADIKIGNSFVFSSKSKIETALLKDSRIESVTVTKKFPGVIKLAIKEFDVVAFELNDQSQLIALLASGVSVVTNTERLQIMDKPILTGWMTDDVLKKELMKQLSTIDQRLLSDISEISPIPSIAFPDRILIYTRTKFEVITSISMLSEKIVTMNGVIETQAPGRITLLLADTFVPFDYTIEDMEKAEEEETNEEI